MQNLRDLAIALYDHVALISPSFITISKKNQNLSFTRIISITKISKISHVDFGAVPAPGPPAALCLSFSVEIERTGNAQRLVQYLKPCSFVVFEH